MLTPETPARWGRMNARRMLAHLTDWMRMASGELPTRARRTMLRHAPVKQLVVYWMPFPKGVPTAEELIAREATDWTAEQAALRQYIESYASMPTSEFPPHPAFDILSPRAWGVLGYRHTDHHLRQFGV